MNQLPRQHRQLLAYLGVVTLLTIAAWVLILLPMQRSRDAAVADNQRMALDLNSRAMPQTPDKIRTLLQAEIHQRDALRQRYNDTWDRVMTQFRKKIDLYDSVQGFRKSITLLDYQETFLETRAALAAREVYLDEGILGLSETSADSRSYRIYAQLLLVRDVAEIARNRGLTFHDDRAANAPRTKDGRFAARIATLPTRTYNTDLDATPFVEEFSLRCSVTGNAQAIASFLADLTSADTFVACRQISLQKAAAGPNPTDDRVTATIVCSAYLMMRDKEQTHQPPETEKKVLWQPGA